MKKQIEDKYKKLTNIEHILKRPARYLGSISPHHAETWVVEDDVIIKKMVVWNPAQLKMFDEIISNSVDEAQDNKKLDTIKVSVDINSGKIEVWDNGGIPVVKHKEHDLYIPEMVFGELHAGSNFNDEDESFATGQNGEGASLTNVFSTKFNVDTCDGKNRLVQKFKNNMSERSVPDISKGSTKYTKITYTPDYKRMGQSGISKGTYDKIIKRVYDIAACNPKLKVSINGKRIKIKSFKDYIKLYTDNYIYDETENWKIGVAHSDDGFQHISFVNSTETTIGGTHINYVIIQIQEQLRAYVEKKYKVKVRPADIRNHITLFVDAKVSNPRYASQTKEDLITEVKDYKTEYVVPDLVIKKIIQSNIIESLIDWIEAKKLQAEQAALKQAKKGKKKSVPTHIPANSKNRDETILFITEGLSAQSNLINVRDSNIHGGFPLKGKPKNISEMKPTDILKNEELSSLMSIIGLSIGDKPIDLNYGKIAIMADADEDGKSITALLINFFSIWPDLFDGRLYILKSPIIIAKKGKQVKRFYHYDDFKKEQGELKDWQIDYLKGLGTLTLDEYDVMINKPILDKLVLDKKAKGSLNIAFGKDANLRKKWLLGE